MSKKEKLKMYDRILERNPNYSSWIRRNVDNDKYVFCSFCNIGLLATKFSLDRHTKSKDHIEYEEKFIGVPERKAQDVKNIEVDDRNDVEKEEEQDSSKIITPVTLDENYAPKENLNNHHYNYGQCYRNNWKEKYGNIIQCIENDKSRVKCIICNITLVAKSVVIDNHLNSLNHNLNINGKKIEMDKLTQEIIIAKIKFAAMCAYENKSFQFIGELTNYIKNIITDSEIARNIHLDAHTVKNIISEVIAPAQKKRLTEILKKTKFSIQVDESTDNTVDSYFCITIRYPDESKTKIVDTLWDLIPVYDKNENSAADADSLFNKIIHSFNEAGIDLNNIISFTSDNANVLMGVKNSVATRLTALLKNIIKVRCNCHLEHLCARNAVQVLPAECLNLVNLIYNYISSSSNRMRNWKILQERLHLEKSLTILRPCTTRWLSMYNCILRIVRRWSPLQMFFEREASLNSRDTDVKSAEYILEMLNNPTVKVYLTFLETALTRLSKANEEIQTINPIVPETRDKFIELYLQYLRLFMKDQYIENYVDQSFIIGIDPLYENEYKDLNQMDIGKNTKNCMETCNLSNEEKIEILETLQAFYVELCLQMQKRFNLDEDRLVYAKCFHPKNALSKEFHDDEFPTLDEIFSSFRSIIDENNNILKSKINKEWQELHNLRLSENLVKINNKKEIDDFWFYIKNYQDNNGNFIYQNIATFALHVLCIPNSNATPERIWSKLTQVKCKNRENLKFENVCAIIMASQYIKDEGGLLNFVVTEEMIERMQKPIRTRKRKSANQTCDYQDGSSGLSYGNIELNENHFIQAKYEDNLYKKKYSEIDTNIKNVLIKKIKLEIDNNEEKITESNKNIIPDFIIEEKSEIDDKFKNMKIESHEAENNDSIKHDSIANEANDDLHKVEIKCETLDESNNTLEVHNENIFENELFMISEEKSNVALLDKEDINYTIGIYKGINNHPIRDYRTFDDNGSKPIFYPEDYEITLFSSEYTTVRPNKSGEAAYIDGDVIDAFSTINEKQWKNAIFVPTQITKILLVDMRNRIPPNNWFMYHLQTKFSGQIFMPYEKNKHWCLFVIDVTNKTVMHLDPLSTDENNISERLKMCFENFQKYLKIAHEKCENNLNSILKWKIRSYRGIRPLQKDGYNCGVYVMYYMDCIGKHNRMKLQFDPQKYRRHITQYLIDKSECMRNVCLFCFNRTKHLDVTCGKCKRLAHKSCFNKYKSCDLTSNICILCSN